MQEVLDLESNRKKRMREEMSVLEGKEPQRVWHYFEEICKIPHGSGNVEKISNYLVEFAKAHGLSCVQDEMKNVIIKKSATPGYEEEPCVILQGHMDMVAVKKPGSDIDLKKDGLKLCTQDDYLYARDTSLGGDDGIAVAYALALLDAEDIPHPALEVIITVDEEVGMDGAREIDLSDIQGKRMLNLDSEEEGIFLTSCAGGARINCHFPVSMQEYAGEEYRISVEGLLGGHSGEMIDKERGNANMIMGRLLYRLSEALPLHLVSLEGGLADNAIPRHTVAQVILSEEHSKLFENILNKTEQDIKKELCTKDPDFQITTVHLGETLKISTDEESTMRFTEALMAFPNGVQAMSAEVPGLVETSLNLGIMQLSAEKRQAVCAFSVRSSIESAKYALLSKVEVITRMCDGTSVITGEYPGWAYRVDSPLREKCVAVYEKMYGKKPQLTAIHAGLECGLLAGKIQDLDCISLGPDMQGIHTTEEKLSISSVQRVWEYLLSVLATKD